MLGFVNGLAIVIATAQLAHFRQITPHGEQWLHGGALAMIGYALALWSADAGVDIIGAAVFGIALVLLLDIGEIGRRWEGAEIAAEVMRAQLAYRFGRTAIAAAAVALLSLCGAVLAVLVPAGGQAIVAGAGALIAFAAAVYAGILREARGGA